MRITRTGRVENGGVRSLINVKDDEFGAIGNGAVDDTTAIQKAFDEAAAIFNDEGRILQIYFPPGTYNINSTLVLGNIPIIADYPGIATIVWQSADPGVMLRRDDTIAGLSEYFKIENLSFEGGTVEPTTMIDLQSTNVQEFGKIRNCSFKNCSDSAILVNNFRAIHWYDLEFVDVGGYAINITASSTSIETNIVIDRFTYTHSRTSSVGKGFLRFDNTIDTVDTGTLQLTNAAIRVVTAWDASSRAVIELVQPNPPTGDRTLRMLLTSVSYHDTSGMADDAILFRNTADTTQAESLTLVNVDCATVANTVKGGWPTTPRIPQGKYFPVFTFDNIVTASLSSTNYVTATTTANVTHSIEVFDENGVSLGFIAVYDQIN